MDYTTQSSNRQDVTDNKEFDITFANYEWEHIRATSSNQLPTCRNCHTATQFKHFMIIFGGKEGEGRKKFCNDIHILDLQRFQWLSNYKVIGDPPDVRMGHSAQNYQNKIVYYGGWNGYNVLDDIIMMTPTEQGKQQLTIQWNVYKSENQSPKRQFHTANIQDNVMYIFGGGDGKMWLSDLFKFDFISRLWQQIETTGTKPVGRLQHSSCIFDKKIYVFGGEPDRSHQLNDLYQLDLETNNWILLPTQGTIPSPRVSASAVLMNNKIFFFGGYDGTQWRNDVFLFNILDNQWEFIIADNPPKPRCRHSAISYKGQIVVFGGNDSEKSYNDVFLLRQCNLFFLFFKQEGQLIVAESTLKQDLANLLFNPILSDITFIVENEHIQAHKVILCARCDYFKAQFLNEQFQNIDKFIINDTKANVFKAILEFIYTDDVQINSHIVYDLLMLSDKYVLNRLKNLCEEFLIKNISLKNVIDIVNLSEKYGASELKFYAMKFLLDNKAKICQSPVKDDLHQLSKDILIELLKITK